MASTIEEALRQERRYLATLIQTIRGSCSCSSALNLLADQLLRDDVEYTVTSLSNHPDRPEPFKVYAKSAQHAEKMAHERHGYIYSFDIEPKY